MTCRISTVDRQIGRLVAYHRKRKGVLQRELAERIGVCSMQISRYESGREYLSLARRQDIAEALGLDLQTFADPTLMEVTAEERAHIEALRAGRRSPIPADSRLGVASVEREAAPC